MANRFFVVGGVDTNWGTVGNWSTTSGGAGGSAVPTAADDVTLDASSGSACVIDTSARVCLSFTSTAFTGTLTFDQQLSVSGSITYDSSTTFAGTTTNKLRMIAAGTWTSNGVVIPQNIEIGGSTAFTCTLPGSLESSGTLFLTNTTSTTFSGGFDITVADLSISGTQTVTMSSDILVSGTSTIVDDTVLNGAFQLQTGGLVTTGSLTGSAAVRFNGTGTWTGGTGSLSQNIVIDISAGMLTLSGTILYSGASIVWVSGVVAAGVSTLSISSSVIALETAGMAWHNISFTEPCTVTLDSELLATGTLSTVIDGLVTFTGAFGFDVGTVSSFSGAGTRQTGFEDGRTYIIRLLPASLVSGNAVTRIKNSIAGTTIVTLFQRGGG